jgi:phosphoribosyl-dephospho-CoA transferase
MSPSPVRPHYLLGVDAAKVIGTDGGDDQAVPSWAFRELRETSLVVVRRGLITQDRIPIGIRGPERTQRWAALYPLDAVQQIITPMDLLNRFNKTEDLYFSRACNGLRSLLIDYQWFTHSWGPGGSVGFELATGKRTTTPRSDLDIVIYADQHLSRTDAKRLLSSARRLDVAVDIRVETPVCGFSLAEYVEPSAKSMLLRTSTGPILSNDPWSEDLLSKLSPISKLTSLDRSPDPNFIEVYDDKSSM